MPVVEISSVTNQKRGVMGVNTLLTIGGLLLVSIFILSGNQLITANSTVAEQGEAVLTAFSMAQSVIDEAKSKSFDEKAIAGTVAVSDSLSSTLGVDAGESITTPDTQTESGFSSGTHFDDFDDYNGYSRTVSTPRGAGYHVSVAVDYVAETNPDSTIAGKSFCKIMSVIVTSPYFTSPVSLSYATTY